MRPLISELNRRNVTRVAAAYALSGWILIEAGSVLLPTFGAPQWVFKAWVLAVAAGFLVAVVFAWVFEITPEGIKREKDIDRSQSIVGQTGRKLNLAIIVLLALALVVSLSFNVVGLRGSGDMDDSVADLKSIAVLPFESRSADPENVFFTDGIHDDLLTTLANIGALKVISRTSVMEYRNTTKNLRQIAEDLGVGTVLEGAVQKSGDTVRINVQLIDARSDQPLWAKTYDRALNTRNIFAMQSEISAEIARALKATLTESEQDRIESVPTDNLAAYNLVQAGRNGLYQRRFQTMQQARTQFEQAIELDPDYARAYVGLADSLMLLLTNHVALPRDEALSQAEAALDRALVLDPEDADVYASIGLLRTTQGGVSIDDAHFQQASDAFRRAIELAPNHVQAHMWYASLINSRGDNRTAISLYQRALELDPLSRIPRLNLAGLYAKLGDNDLALDMWLEAVRLHPDWPSPYHLISAHLARMGRLDEALAWGLKGRDLSTDPLAGGSLVNIYLELDEPDNAMGVLAALPPDHAFAGIMQAAAHLVAEDFAAALSTSEAWLATTPARPDLAYGIAYVAALLVGDHDRALKYLQLKSSGIEDGNPDDVTSDTIGDVVALAYVLQQNGEAERAAPLLVKALDVSRTIPRLGVSGHGLVDVQALALMGRGDEALAALEDAIAEGFVGSAAFSFWRIDEDPYLTSLGPDLRFQAIVASLQRKVDVMRQRVDAARMRDDWEGLLSVAGSRQIAAR